MRKPITNDRITRWLLLIQEFHITIIYNTGKENHIANFLSGIWNGSGNDRVDEYIFTHFHVPREIVTD